MMDTDNEDNDVENGDIGGIGGVKDMIINKLTSELEHEKTMTTRLKNEVDLLKLENENLKKRARGEGMYGGSNKRARLDSGGGLFGGCDIL